VVLRAATDGDLWRRAQNHDGCPGGSKSTNHAWKDDETHRQRLAAGCLPDDVEERLSRLGATDVARVWLAAYEGHYRDWLLATLERRDTTPQRTFRARPEAQAVFVKYFYWFYRFIRSSTP